MPRIELGLEPAIGLDPQPRLGEIAQALIPGDVGGIFRKCRREFRGVLGDLAADVGLDRDELNLALESNLYQSRLRENAVAARNRGVDGVPTFFLGDYPLVGAQSEQVVRQILQRYAQKMAATT